MINSYLPGDTPLSPSGSRWPAIWYRPPYGFTGWGERQTGHEAVLRTLTCHLPTNLPAPLHSEVIYARLQPTKSESPGWSLCWQNLAMTDKRVGAENRKGSAPRLLFPASLYYCFNKRAASRSRHRLGSSQEYQSVSSSAIFLRLLDRMLSLPNRDQSATKFTAGQWL
jgi:hypothetical protein